MAALAILIFGAGSLAVVYVASGGRGLSSGAGGAPAPPAEPPMEAPPPPAPPRAPAAPDLSRWGSPGAPPRPMEYAPAPPRPAAGSWEAIPMVARLASLGPLAAAVRSGLQDLEPRLSECFDRPDRGSAVRAAADAAEGAVMGPTVLVLQLETREGEIRVVDAPVATRGETDDGTVACIQRVLRGQTFPASGARAGARHRVLHPLIQ